MAIASRLLPWDRSVRIVDHLCIVALLLIKESNPDCHPVLIMSPSPGRSINSGAFDMVNVAVKCFFCVTSSIGYIKRGFFLRCSGSTACKSSTVLRNAVCGVVTVTHKNSIDIGLVFDART